MKQKLYVSEVLHADDVWNYQKPDSAFVIFQRCDVSHISFLASDENEIFVNEIIKRAEEGREVPSVIVIRTNGYKSRINWSGYEERISNALSLCNYKNINVKTCSDTPIGTFFFHQNI
jgi:hypothetical protein